MKSFLGLLLVYIGIFPMQAQVQDSVATALKLQIETAHSDSLRIPIQLKLAEHLSRVDTDAARTLITDTQNKLNTKEATIYYQQLRAKMFQTLSLCDELQQKLIASLNNIQQAIDIASGINDSLILGRLYLNRGSISISNKDTINGKYYYRKAFQIQKKINDTTGMAKSYIYLGVLYYTNPKQIDYDPKQIDSMAYYLNEAKQFDKSLETRIHADVNLASYYLYNKKHDKARLIYESLIIPHKKLKNYQGLSHCFSNLAVNYAFQKEFNKSLQLMDSAIVYSKIIGYKKLLSDQYLSRSRINNTIGEYKAAYDDFKLHKVYFDSINDVEEVKRFTEIELNYKFEKEKELAALELKNETNKKKIYLAFFLTALFAALIILYLVRKNNKQKLNIAELEVLKADLALDNREKELKQILVESSVRKNVLKQTLDQVKQIIDLKGDTERRAALKTLSALLLSDKAEDTAASVLETYLDEVSIDFKVLLDIHYPTLKPKEKELLCLMKMGLSNAEISKLLGTSIVAIKSTRYRIRKKLQIDAKQDIIQYLESKAT